MYEIGALWLCIWLCHTEESIRSTYEIGELMLRHTDEMQTPTFEIATDLMSYGRDNKSYT